MEKAILVSVAVLMMCGSCGRNDKTAKCEDGAAKGTYSFRHEGLEYIVGYLETVREPDGSERDHEYLIVRQEGRTILKQERLGD